MNKWGLIGVFLLMSLIAVFSAGFQVHPGNTFSPAVKDTGKKAPVTIDEDYGKMPLSFIPNRGQMDRQVYFYLQGKDKSVYFTSTGLTYALAGPSSSRWVVKLDFVNARKDAKPECLEKSGTVISYFKGQPEAWQTGLPAASKIIYRELWPGIDLVYYGTVSKIKYEFIVHPGADPAQIKLAYRGAASVKENSQGQLEVQTPVGGFFDDTPVAWQEIAGKRETVSLKYALENRNPSNSQDAYIYGFSVGEYNKNKILILDPAVLVYCGYIGGSGQDWGHAIAVDGSGCAYVTGCTASDETTFPETVGPDLTHNGSTWDVFVAKVNADGTGLVYCGYIGGSNSEIGYGIAVDASGCAYITGQTRSSESTFPVTIGPDLTYSQVSDVFVAKVSADGTGLLYCGYIGGGDTEEGRGIAVDGSGCAYVTGYTYSSESTFPVAIGPDLTLNVEWDDLDAFVAKVKADGTALDYCGYIGGAREDWGMGIAVDTLGCAYVGGFTNSPETSFPVAIGPDLTLNGDNDAFVAKVKADGTALDYCGYIGGASTDKCFAITLDASNCAYITGVTYTLETSFPVTVGPDLTFNGGDLDVFVAKLNASGTALDYCGYIGGSLNEFTYGITVDTAGCAYVTGFTASTQSTFPVINGPDLTFNGGGGDGFAAKITADGSALEYCGYIGGSNYDTGYGIAVDAAGSSYVVGYARSDETTFPVTVGPDLTHNGGTEDVFVAKISYTDEGSISGRVTDSTGTTGVADVEVDIFDMQGNRLSGTTTDIDGYYTLQGYSAGDYKIQFVTRYTPGNYVGEWYNDKNSFDSADTVTVTVAQITVLSDALLDNGGAISGRSTDVTGTIGVSAGVGVYDLNNNGLPWVGTSEDGYYQMNGVPAGTYKVYFHTDGRPNNYISGWHLDKDSFDNADTVQVFVGQTTADIDGRLQEGGYISGRVTDSSGTVGIANVDIYVFDINDSENSVASASTDGNGDYTVSRVPAGDYKVQFQTGNAGNYIEEWYNNQGSFNNADTVTVTAGSTTGSIDAQLADGGIISGKVMDSLLAGIENVCVNIYDSNYNWVSNGWTDSNGDYTIQGLPPGNYKVYFDTWNASSSYLCEWYNDKGDFDSADAVVVTAGATTGNINAVLADGGAISGRVTDSTGTVGIANVDVGVCDLAQYWLYGTSTDSDGYYTINAVPTGSYKVQFNTDSVSGNYVREWYSDKVSFNDADVVNVTNGTVTSGIDAQLADGGSISGRVTDSGNNGIANVNVNIHDLNGNNITWSSTDSNGDYTVKGIPTGDHKVQFWPWNAGNYIEEWYNDQVSFDSADTVSVTAGNTTTGIDAQLADGGAISGRVTDSTGTTGLASIEVQICDLAGYGYPGTNTDNDGYYTLRGLPTGDYKVEFRSQWGPGNYIGEWYNDKSSFETADTISVTVGQTTTDIDAQLADGGAISGRVTDSSGTLGIVNVNIQVCDLNGYWYHGVHTDGNGYYTIYGLPAGSYKIQFNTNNAVGSYVGEWYNDKSSFENADAVSVTVGQTTTGIDAQLAEGGYISGRVTDIGDNGIANININVHDMNGNNIAWSSTNSNGDYTVGGIPAGDFKVQFWVGNAGNYISEWYNDKGSFENADAVTVTVGNTTTGIDAQLADSGAISGRVTDSSGTVGIANVDVQVCDLAGYWYNGNSTDINGYYTIYGIPGGSYKVQFRTKWTSGNYVGEWYNDQGSFNDADTVIVTVGSTTTGIDAQLADGGSMSGRVTDSGNNGIANVNVNVHDMNQENIAWSSTDSNGDYTVKGIPTGDHKVQFGPWNAGNYIEEWYNDKGSFNDADTVSITAGNTTTGIDAQLADSGAISGRVTDSFGTVGIASVEVQVCDLSGYWYNGTNTDNDGYYTLRGLPAGDYKVEFRTHWGPGNYVGEWYNDQDSFDNADTISVTIGQTTTGIDARLADSGAVSGRITDSTGTVGIANVNINVSDLTGNGYHGVHTDGNGYYTLHGLPGGSYKVHFNTNNAIGNYVGEWYNDQDSFDNADPFTVTVGQTTTGIDAQLADGGAISGRVTDESNNGIANVNVNIYDLNDSDNSVNSVATDSSGNYTVQGFAGGDYKVQFWPGDAGNYLEEWYNDQWSYNDADLVTVTAGSTTTGIDAQLADGGAISGRVTDSTGTVGIENVHVQMYDLAGNWYNGTSTDSDGYYTIQGLTTGDYKVEFRTNWTPGNYVGEWYNDKNSFENADTISVTVGQTTTGIDAQLADGGAVSGRVTDSTGTVGIANVDVQACDLNGYWLPGVNTDGSGYYTIYGLPAGSYKIQFNTSNVSGSYVSEWYNDKNSFETADAISVTVGQTTTGIDALLADGGYISGRVTDIGNNGIASISVNVHDMNNNSIAWSSTDSNGDYTVRGVPAGNCKVQFWVGNAGNYISEWYNNQGSFASADAVSVTVGNTTTGIDAQLADSGAISGRVTDSTGTVGIANVDVQICDLAGYWLHGTSTDINGYYTIYGIPGGSYKVQFSTEWVSGNYVGEWYNDQDSFNNADTVIVTVGSTITGIDAQLANGGSISGRVTDSGNNGIANVNVNVHDMSGNNIAWSSTDSNGDYTVKGIPSGNHKVQFWPWNAGNYIEEWYNDQGSFNDADTILVIAGQTNTGIDAQLSDSGAISGRVTDSSGTVGISSVEVQVCDLNGYWYNGTNTDNDGYYTLRGLPAGDYKVEFRTHWGPGNYLGEWYNDKDSFETADAISVTLGQTTTGINAQLADSGAISGRITDSSGTVGIANVDVQVFDLNGNGYCGVSTDGSGYYTRHGLPAGNYKVKFDTNNAVGNYVNEWYNDQASFESADTVSVTVGVTTTGIDAQLADGGAISGRVTDESNNGIANVNVNIYDLNNSDNCITSTATDSSGNYTVQGFAGGDYKVQFWPGDAGNYLEEWYNDQWSYNDADLVTVTAGSTTTGIDAQLTTGGIITGKVMDSSLMGIENVRVYLYDLNYNWINSWQTDSYGDYTIEGLASGSYKIYFEACDAANSYINEWYNNASEFDNANEVAVTAGQTTYNINAVLDDGGAISGRVTNSTGSVGIANVEVQICDLNWYWQPGTNTDSDGYYTLKGIPGGDYKIEFRAHWVPGNYVSEWYNDQDSFDNADPVTVTVGQTTTGINAQLADGGGVSGRVTDSSGTNGIGNVNVNICDLSQHWLHGVNTDNDGYYTIYGVPDGSYKIQFDPHHAGNYPQEWWNNKRSFENADTVIVTTGNTVTGIDAQLEEAGSITGTVTDDSTAAAIEDVRVYVYDLANNEMGNCWTDASGNYTVGNLYPGNFKVFFQTSNVPIYIEEWYNDQDSFANANEVTVNEGAATTVNAALSAVQDDSYEPNNDFNSAAEVTTGPLNNLVYLSPDGAGIEQDWYKVYVGPEYSGQDLKVNIKVTSPYPQDPPGWWGSDLDFQIYDGAGGLLGIVVSSSDDETLYIANLGEGWYYICLNYCTIGYGPGGTGVHADYSMTVEISDSFAIGYISGRVTDEQGQGIGGSLVQLMHSPNNWAVSFPNIATDADGYYTVAYNPGDYTVLFNYHIYAQNPPPPNYVSEYYNDQTLQADAQVFTLHVGTSITGIDAELMAGATIEGTLTHANGNPIVENYQGQVLVYDKDIGYTVSYDYNDASGNYSVKYLPPGSFKIRFRGRDENWQWYAREWYNDQPSLGTGHDVVISTVGEVLTGINNQFSAGGILQGQVTDSGGGGIPDVRVCVYHPSDPDYTMVSGYTNGNGDFYIREVFPGEVKVFFDADDQNTAYLSEWYNNQGDFNAADLVSVSAGQTTSGIDAQLGDKGSISGRVTDSSGSTGIADVNVNINDLNGDWINGTNTDANGDYTINGIPAGDYKVEFNPDNASGNYIREWYNDKNSFNNADTVTVIDGQTTSGIDAQLADGASIGGQVTDSSGTMGIQDVEVRLHDPAQNYITEAMTDSDGYYTIQGLEPGNYKIEFQTHHVLDSYVGEWYNDKSSFNSADTLSVTAGQALTGIDAQLADGGTISGRVTDATGTVGIANVEVQICDLTQYWYSGTNTDSDGYYTLKGLAAGDYKIQFCTNWTPGNYVGEWYNDKNTFESADAVPVTVGQTTPGIDAQLASGGAVSGRVTDSSGQGIDNVHVNVYDMNQYSISGVSTDNDGYYTIYGVPAGNFKIEFDPRWATGSYTGEWYNDKSSFSTADPVSVSVGFTTQGIDAQLGEGGVISGRVTDSTGTVGIYNVQVQICDLDHNWLQQGGNTDSDGYYTIQGLPTGDYKIEFRTNEIPGNYVGEWYNDKLTFESADTVSATVGQTTTGIDAQLADGGAISGRVTDSTGTNGIANVDVSICDLNQYWLNGVSTDSQGYYTIYGLAAGTYKVQFNTDWASGSYVGEWYNDKNSFSTADPVSVSVGVTTTGIDAQLADGATISGRVTDSTGTNGIANVHVQMFNTAYNWMQRDYTDNDGYYTIRGISAGDYKIEFRTNDVPGNYAGEWYNDKNSFNSADTLSVTGGQTLTGIDAQLADGGAVSGRVTDSSGTIGIANVDVQICDLNQYWLPGVSTDSDGYYTIYGLPAGDYKIEFRTHNASGNYTNEWYNDKNSFENADPVTVTVGQTTTGIDAQLSEGGAISGRVMDSSGTVGVYNVDVQVYDLNNYWINSTSTDNDGYYTIQGLPSGDYKIEFTTNWTPGDYIGEWYNDKDSFDNADAVSVTVGQTTTGIDAQLADGGSISGRVTDSTGTVGINNVNVNIRDLNHNWYHGVHTDNDGYYTMHGLPAGDYKIEFNPNNAAGNYVREWYNDQNSFDNADPVSVTVGQTTTDIDAQLADAGSISGRVTDSSANGIANVNVQIYDSNNNHINSSNTDSNGDYTIHCLPPGDCKVYYDTWGAGNYIPEWYNDKGAFDEADAISVTAGQTTVDIDAQLAEGGTISGRVTNESAVGLEAVHIRILHPDGSWADGTNTDANGDYSVNRLAPGSYIVDFYTANMNESYVREWYNDKGSFNSADPVTVTAGATTTIDAVLAAGGTVTGRVTNESAVGIQNVRVDLRDMNYSRKAWAYTDENGDYTVKGFPGGSYKVYFNAYTSSENYIPEWYNDKDSFDNGDTISAAAGETVNGIDAVLVPGCSISGTVTDESANPIQFIEVYTLDTGGNWISWTETDSSGNYELNGLLPGSYKVLFYSYNVNQHGVDWFGLPRDYNYKYQYYSNKDYFPNADPVTVTEQSPATGIDAVLTEDAGIISGQITDSLGSPIEGCLAYVFPANENYIDIEISGYTGADGNYQVKGLNPGNYIVLFFPPGGSSYRRIFYNNTLDYDNATEVAVTAGQTTSGINAVLPKGGLITGRVTDGNGNGINDVTLRLLDATTNNYLGWIGNGAMTDTDGYYTIYAQTGQWKLLFMAYSIPGNGYVSEFYNDQSIVENADILTVNVDETLSNIDAVLSGGGGKISGYVKDPTNVGIYGVSVEVHGAQYKYWIGNASTDSSGYFEILGLMPGNYKIYTNYNNIYPSEWYSDKTAHETADVVTVTEGGNTEVTIILGGPNPNPAGISGQVTDYSGSGIENVTVNIYDPGNNFIDSALTDINGDYAVQGIPSGDYKVYFDTSTAGNWLAEWYENKGAFDEADTITVAPGQALTGIDAQLAEGGIISGRVMNETEVSVEGVQVKVRDLENDLITTANTDANGDYTIQRLPANSYKVYFDVKNANGYYVGQWYNNRDSFDTANIVIVMAGGTSTVDAILGDGIGISGTVTDDSLNPLLDIDVEIYETNGLYVTGIYTDNNGNYEVKGLAPGNYKVYFSPWAPNHHGIEWYGLPADTNYKFQWYNNKEYFADADVVTAAPGSAATGIDAVMTDGEGGIISGQITDNQANGIAGCLVYALQSEDAHEWYYSDPVKTGADGNYQVKGLPTGDYVVFFIQPGGTTYYRRQFYNNTRDRDLATLVSVTAGQTTPGINAVLQKGGIVTGRVTNSSGKGLENVYIRLMDAATNKYLGWVGNTAQTDADGYFTINGLAGQWKVMFQSFAMIEPGYISEFYNNRAAVENGDMITVAVEEEVANINAVLSQGGGKISGFVKDPGNTGLYNVTVYLYDTQYKTFVGHTETDLNGYFEIPGLIPGSYKLHAFYNRVYPSEWYSDSTTYAAADELTVIAGGNTQVLVMLGAPDPVLPLIQVTSPNGGESLTGGTTHNITWDVQGNMEAVFIEYSIDNGANWITIEPFAENTGIYQWTVPETPSDNCLVRIGASDSDAGPVDTSDAVFSIVTIGPASINLKSPNRWVSITAGTTEEITWYWTGGGAADNIILEYSIDSGQTWLMIVPGTANTGSYSWYVPNTPSEHCLIRIQVGEGDEVLSAISEVEFSIVTPAAPVLHVTSPNGGETWKVGYFYNITWDTIGTIEDVKLEYSINGGGSWTGIIASTPNTGIYEWTVPDSPAESCFVRVSDALGGSTDTSDESFAIVPAPTATLDVTSPNGGESLTTGTTHDITWTSSGMENVESVMIEYSEDNGVTWTTVEPAAAHNGTGGSYNWTVPDTPSETCLVRITNNSSDEGPSDVSDAVFSIEPAPFITVTTPNGGEQWKTGSTYAINWTYSGITGNVVIDLYRGTTFDSNITTTAVDTGSFDWNIPISFTNADDYKVLIYQDTIEDYSDNYFTISDQAPNNPDFNNDGSVDILWRNYAAGGNEVWLMNGAVRTDTVSIQAEAGLDWRIVGTGDFNRDGKVDLLWRNYTNGQNRVWFMNGTAVTGTASLQVLPDVSWQIAGTGDFNGDGSVDILWRHAVEGRNQVWYMNGVTVTGYMGTAELKDTSWRIAGLGDFNDDDKVDILWRNYVTGYNQVWYMNGVTFNESVDLMENTDLTWQIAGTGDFNKDGKIDILWRRYSDGMNMIWYMDGIVRLGFEYIETRSDLTWRIVGNGDYKE